MGLRCIVTTSVGPLSIMLRTSAIDFSFVFVLVTLGANENLRFSGLQLSDLPFFSCGPCVFFGIEGTNNLYTHSAAFASMFSQASVSLDLDGSIVVETGAPDILPGASTCVPGPPVLLSCPPVGVVVMILVVPVVRPMRVATHVIDLVTSLTGRAGSLGPVAAGGNCGGGKPCGGMAGGSSLVLGTLPGEGRGATHLQTR